MIDGPVSTDFQRNAPGGRSPARDGLLVAAVIVCAQSAEIDVAFREQTTVEPLGIDEGVVANMNDSAACNCVATAPECPASQQRW